MFNSKCLEPLLLSLLFITVITSGCQKNEPLWLATEGEYQFGTIMNAKYSDANRGDKVVNTYIWYPAIVPEGAEPSRYNFDAEPDRTGAPYPVILMSAKVGGYFGPHLATHGFMVIGVDGQDSKNSWGTWLLDYPLDQAFALEEILKTPPNLLQGMFDGNLVGVTGYSFDGYDALALAGARVDPEYYKSQCKQAQPGDPYPEQWWIDYICKMDGEWDNFVTHAGLTITESDDGLWQPITSPRIKAALPMAPEGAWLFGPDGLGAIQLPIMIIGATEDDINYYDLEAVTIYENLGSESKQLVSFIGQGHMMIFDEDQVNMMKHLMTAFFGYHLQGKTEYGALISEEGINQQEGLVSGILIEN